MPTHPNVRQHKERRHKGHRKRHVHRQLKAHRAGHLHDLAARVRRVRHRRVRHLNPVRGAQRCTQHRVVQLSHRQRSRVQRLIVEPRHQRLSSRRLVVAAANRGARHAFAIHARRVGRICVQHVPFHAVAGDFAQAVTCGVRAISEQLPIGVRNGREGWRCVRLLSARSVQQCFGAIVGAVVDGQSGQIAEAGATLLGQNRDDDEGGGDDDVDQQHDPVARGLEDFLVQ